MVYNESGYTKKELPDKIKKLGIILFIIGAVTGIIGFFIDPARASYSYLTSFIFLLTITVGALLIVAIEYAAGANWSTPFRRVGEFLAVSTPLLVLLVIPILFNTNYLFSWTNSETVAADKILQAKAIFLNTPFFSVRVIVILLIWAVFYYFIVKNSAKQDISGNQLLTKKNIILSSVFIPIFALTLTLQSIDLIMSLETKWFSTLFGIYVFAGIMPAALAAVTYISIKLKENGYLHSKITKDHFYSLGTLLFSFVAFWGYIAFTQYLVIWYGNLPEETFWFMERWAGGWKIVSILLILGNFVIPFFALISYSSKTNLKKLKFFSIWIIVFHFLDIYWLIMPSMNYNGLFYSFSWIDISFLLAALGIIIYFFTKMVKKYNLIPIKDPKLKQGLDFHL